MSETSEQPQAKDPLKRLSNIVLVVCAVLFIWYVVGDRYVPSTAQARVRGYVIPIAPQVAGTVSRVSVTDNLEVEPGQLLVQIDPREYELAVAEARVELEQAGQAVGADTAAVEAAQGRLAAARADLDSKRRDIDRVMPLAERGVIPMADAERYQGLYETSQANLETARADLEQARQRLGAAGNDSPKVRAALLRLENAQLDLERTALYAPSAGGITNLRIDEGRYASIGQPLMTFVSASQVWIEASMRENSIGNIRPGDPVDIVLDVAPGRVFSGEVASIAFGVDTGADTTGGLAKTEQTSGWLRDPQRFPVIIKFSDDDSRGLRREGGQADVLVYTSNNWIFNPLGWLWIRLVSLVSYIY